MTPRVAIGLLVLFVSAPTVEARQSFVCSAILAGETGPALAFRLTGDTDSLYRPWFRIADANGRFVPQSQYPHLRSNWRVCLAADSPTLPRQSEAAGAPDNGRRYDIDFAVRIAAAVFLVLLPWSLLDEYLRLIRPVPAPLRDQALCFVAAFARPLVTRSSALPPIKSRLRYLPAHKEVEILLAPSSGRRYPNLTDHRVNVEYDVRRVLRLLDDRLVVTRPLRIEGRWVVIPLRSNADVKDAGAT